MAHEQGSTSIDPDQAICATSISHAFQPSAWERLTIVPLPAGATDVVGISHAQLPLLVCPQDMPGVDSGIPIRVLVAAEGADRKITAMLSSLLSPATVTLAIIHVTWVPGIASSPLPEQGLDNPQPIDLLIYRGANDALVDTAAALRDARFTVTTHLREARQPAGPILTEISRTAPDMFVLGLGRHGEGIGRDVLREIRLPILYVNAR